MFLSANCKCKSNVSRNNRSNQKHKNIANCLANTYLYNQIRASDKWSGCANNQQNLIITMCLCLIGTLIDYYEILAALSRTYADYIALLFLSVTKTIWKKTYFGAKHHKPKCEEVASCFRREVLYV